MTEPDPSPGVGSIDGMVLDARFVRCYPPAVPTPDAPTFYLPFSGYDLVVRDDATLATIPPFPLSVDSEDTAIPLYIGDLDGKPCVTYRLPNDAMPLPDGFRTVGLRALYGQIGDDEYALAGYASQLLRWRKTYRFCSRCGSPAQRLDGGWGMTCPACELVVYPPVTPAVLALVHDGGDRVLLASKPGWGTRFSIIAGFTEPGESFEGCVVREVLEEVGVHAREVVYDGSQPWAFPHQIMVGFTCRWVSGEIVIDETELSDARWFRYDELPDLPAPLSLSRQIIDRWVASRG